MRWSAGDRGNIQDMRGRSGGMRAGSLGIGGLLIAAGSELGDRRATSCRCLAAADPLK